MKNKVLKIFHIVFLLIIVGLVVGALFLKYKYPNTTFDGLLFYLKSGLGNADMGVFFDALKLCLPAIIILIIIFYTVFYDILFGLMKIKFKKFQLYPIKIINNHRIIFTILLFVASLGIIIYNLGIFNYAKNNFSKSGFIAKHYVDPHKAYINFTSKRNLIFIVSESLETSFFTKKQGGKWEYDVTPELYKLLNDKDSVTFYNKNKYEGVNMITGATFTTGSVVTNSTGVPFKVPIDKNSYHSKNFMNGTYALGDLLKDNGYYNEVISAATTSFGGLKEYFTKHGNYKIIDINSLENFNLKMKSKDKGNWGFNDKYLFEIAKERIKKAAKNNKPFNMELITIDTHFPEGFLGDYSVKKFETRYENVYATESKLTYNFIKWIKKQKFYKNTTIVIVGDHLNMLDNYFSERGINDRYVYNCIINPAVKPKNNKNRIVTALDFYPTTVAAIGADIYGNQLGLGTNLFSNKKTLAEKYGLKKLNEKLEKKSEFYNDHILNDTYMEEIKNDKTIELQNKKALEEIKDK